MDWSMAVSSGCAGRSFAAEQVLDYSGKAQHQQQPE
jgi:hypothetical protein